MTESRTLGPKLQPLWVVWVQGATTHSEPAGKLNPPVLLTPVHIYRPGESVLPKDEHARDPLSWGRHQGFKLVHQGSGGKMRGEGNFLTYSSDQEARAVRVRRKGEPRPERLEKGSDRPCTGGMEV